MDDPKHDRDPMDGTVGGRMSRADLIEALRMVLASAEGPPEGAPIALAVVALLPGLPGPMIVVTRQKEPPPLRCVAAMAHACAIAQLSVLNLMGEEVSPEDLEEARAALLGVAARARGNEA